MTVAVITAAIGPAPLAIAPLLPQEGHDVSFHAFTNETLPPRPQALHPRLLAKLPKVFGWDMVPPADCYVWIDASMTFIHAQAIKWLVEQLGDADIAVFRHPFRPNVGEEAQYVREHLPRSHRLMVRYAGEYLDAQMAVVDPGLPLYAAGVFIYRATDAVQRAMRVWWEQMTRFHVNDQLSLSYALAREQVSVRRMKVDIFDNPYVRLVTPWRATRGVA